MAKKNFKRRIITNVLDRRRVHNYSKAENPDKLISVAGWYEMNPENDDRPEHVKAGD